MSEPSLSRGLRPLIAVLLLVLLAHWLLFAAYVRREIAWAYPPHFDQVTGLSLAYHTYDAARRDGWWSSVTTTLRDSPANTMLLHLEAALLSGIAGPSRLVALSVNWLHFALFQAVLVAALWARTRRLELPLLGLGLLLSMKMPFMWAGGIADFRPDLAGFCLYGTFLACVWCSDGFRRTRWAMAAGGVATLCVLTRPLTAVYLGGALGLSVVALGLRWWRQRDPARPRDLGIQVQGLFACAATFALTAAPVLVLQARALWAYYVLGHVSGRESRVWADALRQDLLPTLLFYPRSALWEHGGVLFLALAAGGLAALVTARLVAPRVPAEAPTGAPRSGAGWFMAAALVVPYLVLTADSAKSPVVGGLLLVPLLWLVLAATARLAPSCPPGPLRVASVVALAAGFASQAAHLTGPAPHVITVEAIREVDRLHADIIRWVEGGGSPAFVMFADRQRDYVAAVIPVAYERLGLRLTPQLAMGRTLWRPDPEEVMARLRSSQIVMLTRPQRQVSLFFPFPYDAALHEMHPRLLAYCKRNLTRVGTYRVPEEVMLFARVEATRAATTRRPLDAPP